MGEGEAPIVPVRAVGLAVDDGVGEGTCSGVDAEAGDTSGVDEGAGLGNIAGVVGAGVGVLDISGTCTNAGAGVAVAAPATIRSLTLTVSDGLPIVSIIQLPSSCLLAENS